MAFDREAAKAEGYTDDEINAYLQAEAEKNKQTAPAVDVGEPPAPTTKINEVGTSAEAMATTAGLGLAPYAVPAAGVAAAALGGGKIYQGWKSGVDAANKYTATQAANAATHAATQEMKTLQQIAKGSGPDAEAARQRLTQLIQSRGGAPSPTSNIPAQQVRPVAPTPGAYAGATPTSAMGPVSPVVPQGMPPAPKPPSIMAQIRALAANKVLPMAGNLAKGSVGPGMAMYSGSLNTGEEEELRRRRMMPPTISR